jgi:cell division protein FtsQ
VDRRHRGHGPIFRRGVQRAPALKGEVLMDDETRRRLRRAHARKLVSMFFGAMTIAALIGLYFSPFFRVQNIEVTGASDAYRQQIADLVHSKGSSMLTVRFGGAEDRIAEMPQIKSVQIDRSWPDTVRVTVVERLPWGTWIAGSSAYVIDDEGVVLPAGYAAPEGSLVIHALASPPLSAGDRVDRDAVALTKAVVEQAPGRLALTITEVDWSEAEGLTVVTDAGYTVVIGDSENMDFKFAVWQQIESELGRDSMSGHVLDLRFGERPSFQ